MTELRMLMQGGHRGPIIATVLEATTDETASPKASTYEENMDTFNIIAGSISIIAFAFAIAEHWARRKLEALHESRLQLQEARNNAALRSALVGAQNADLMVQRSKETGVTVAELQTLARSLRGVMMTLASELEEQSALMKKWKFSKRMTRSEPVVQSGQGSNNP